jgi:hypothetical protein
MEAQCKDRHDFSDNRYKANIVRIEELERKVAAALKKGPVLCSHCKKAGHSEERCWILHPELKRLSNTQRSIRSYSEGVCFSGTCQSQDINSKTDWILDCGCSHHMSPYVENSVLCTTGKYGGVEMGNNQVVPIYGHGEASACLKTIKLNLDRVFHVPELKNNLLSIGQCTQMGVKYLVEDDVC